MYFSIIIIISILIYSINLNPNNKTSTSNNTFFIYNFNSNSFIWPTPGYYKITSQFGPRKSPTGGASSNHSGIDISAPEKTSIYSVLEGTVSFLGFKGAGRIHFNNKI